MENLNELKILDFRTARTGTLVRRSAHFLQDRCGKAKTQLGVITGFAVFEDKKKAPIVWPVVFWEGNASESTTHPALVSPFRTHTLPTISMFE